MNSNEIGYVFASELLYLTSLDIIICYSMTLEYFFSKLIVKTAIVLL